MLAKLETNATGTRWFPVLILSLLAAWPWAACAEADGPDFYRAKDIPAGDTLAIRAAPNAHAAKRGAIPPGAACIRNLGCKGGLSLQESTGLSPAEQAKRLKRNPRWCKVEYQGVTGWAAGRYLAEGSCP